ncbi:acyl-CoA N-acyltransferase [Pisolithus marmoratus]|nr:acyl-CoA N-acyltransferase [Pisolithus marmoratus]
MNPKPKTLQLPKDHHYLAHLLHRPVASPPRLPRPVCHPPKISGVQRTTPCSHGRTSELLAGGLTRLHLTGEYSDLWVCDRCFKYITEGPVWEFMLRHPPGRKAYQRGAHTIWEVDGAINKLYCQNLSLFSKSFIDDVKTLFFDSSNCFLQGEILVTMVTIWHAMNSQCTGNVSTLGRPLSDLGPRSYLTYWAATIVMCLRRLLSVLPTDSAQVSTEGFNRPTLLFLPLFTDIHPGAHSALTSIRKVITISNPSGSATSHVVVRCTLANIAHSMNLRVEDACGCWT